jgi:hypothetical protein
MKNREKIFCYFWGMKFYKNFYILFIRRKFMKKISLLFIIQMSIIPVFAVCSITGGACSSNFDIPSLQDQFVPNNLQNMQRTDAFQQEIHEPYNHKMLNTKSNQKPAGYDASCQFGVCLPGNSNNNINPTEK